MRYHYITKDDMANGEGLRVVLWLSGCSHRCCGCQNPTTWAPEGGILFDDEAKQELFAQLDKPYISGITLSGGDPLHDANRSEAEQLLLEIRGKYPEKNIWLYTGALWEDVCLYPIINNIDVMVDGEFKYQLTDATLLWRGSSNQRVIDVQHSLRQHNIKTPVLYCK